MPTMKLRYAVLWPRIAPADADPAYGRVRAAARAGDWPALAAQLADLDGPRAEEAVRIVGDVSDATDFLRGVYATRTSDLAQILLAANLISVGWKRRTGARARYVSKARMAAFRAYLDEADSLLFGVRDVGALNGAVWMLRLTVARGLSLGQHEAWSRYYQARDQVAHPLGAQRAMVQALCPKWGGTFEKLHRFAWECMAAAPEGAMQGGLVAEAHLEHWMELNGGAYYLRQQHVGEALDLAAARSVWHPAAVPGPGWLWAHNEFAMAYSMMGRRSTAAAHFAVLGNRATELPWAYPRDSARTTYQVNYAAAYLLGGWRARPPVPRV
jgi:hypothetical protein